VMVSHLRHLVSFTSFPYIAPRDESATVFAASAGAVFAPQAHGPIHQLALQRPPRDELVTVFGMLYPSPGNYVGVRGRGQVVGEFARQRGQTRSGERIEVAKNKPGSCPLVCLCLPLHHDTNHAVTIERCLQRQRQPVNLTARCDPISFYFLLLAFARGAHPVTIMPKRYTLEQCIRIGDQFS